MWSLIGALDKALSLPNYDQILRLYEASVTVTVRMRLDPSTAQMQLDSMGFIDVLRVQNLVNVATSFFEFALSVLRFQEISGQESGLELVTKTGNRRGQLQGRENQQTRRVLHPRNSRRR